MRRLVPGLLFLSLGALALGACGGGDGEAASDDEYVRTICDTVSGLQDELTSLAGSAASEDELLESFAEALNEAADQLDDINAPDDVATSHDQVVDAFRSTADAMEDGDLEALQDFDPGSIQNDPAAQDRLREAASGVEECSGLSLFD